MGADRMPVPQVAANAELTSMFTYTLVGLLLRVHMSYCACLHFDWLLTFEVRCICVYVLMTAIVFSIEVIEHNSANTNSRTAITTMKSVCARTDLRWS